MSIEGTNLMNLTSLNTTECSLFETVPYIIVALVSAGSATFSAVASITVIFLIIVLKKYIFFVQRLILYLCGAALITSLAIMLRFQQARGLEPDPPPNNGILHILCVASGFIEQMTAWSIAIAFCCITFNLLLTAVFKKNTEKLELVYIGLIFMLPIMFNWIPFLHDTYGDAGAWCWIKSMDINCETILFGVYLRFILWYVPGSILIVGLIVTYIFIFAWVTRQRRKWAGKYDHETETLKKKLQEEVWPLMFYPLGFLILNIFSLINRVHDTFVEDKPLYELWILHAIFSPLQGGYIALVYILSKDTRKSLSCTRIKAALCHKEATISEYPVEGGRTDSWSEARNTRNLEREKTDTLGSRKATCSDDPRVIKDDHGQLEAPATTEQDN